MSVGYVAVAVLAALAIMLGVGAGKLLHQPDPPASPGDALVGWYGVLTGFIGSVIGVVVVLPLLPWSPGHRLIEWLAACLHGKDPGTQAATFALIIGAAVLFAGLVALLVRTRRARDRRAVKAALLDLVAVDHPSLTDVRVLAHELPVAFCFAPGPRPIVLSDGAVVALADSELSAVLAHERAHLQRRHHLALAALHLVAPLGHVVPTLRQARTNVPVLLELDADLVAVRLVGAAPLIAALRKLSPSACSPATLSAAGVGDFDKRSLAALAGSGDVCVSRSLHFRFGGVAAAVTPLMVTISALAGMVAAC